MALRSRSIRGYVCDWVVRDGPASDKRNPFDNHKISGGKGSTSDRLPFSRPMLDLLDAKPLRPTWVRIPPPPPVYNMLI